LNEGIGNYNLETLDEYLDTMHKEEDEKKERKFKKLFTVKGKFASLAKNKCKQSNP
jgi:hypothetical protein